MNNKAMLVALALPIILLIGVLIGVRQLNNPAVGLGMVEAPQADSQECAELLENLPSKLDGHRRSALVDPAPSGAAAWSKSITLRCGVNTPYQYNALSITETVNNIEWLTVQDTTPGSDLKTYYAVNTDPVVAITVDGDYDPREKVTKPLSVLQTLSQEEIIQLQHPLPLEDIHTQASVDTQAYAHALPEVLSTNDTTYTRVTIDETTIGYHAVGQESIVIKLGTDIPSDYEAGAQLQQVNNVPWFESTILANGTTGGVWSALGEKIGITVFVPASIGNTVLVTLSDTFAQLNN